MKRIKFLLDKLQIAGFSQDVLKKEIRNLIQKEFGLNIGCDDLILKSPFLLIREENPVIRNEILINQQKIIEKILLVIKNNARVLSVGGQSLKKIQFRVRK